nr:MAG TPA: hypothetical protein [Caudoviricetes sp.]
MFMFCVVFLCCCYPEFYATNLLINCYAQRTWV